MCININCGNSVDFGSIEVVGEGFVCSVECEDVVLGINSDDYDTFDAFAA